MAIGAVERARSASPVWTLGLAVGALLVLVLSLLVEVRIVVVSPDVGDISDAVRLLVQVSSTLIGTVAAGITIYDHLAEDDGSDDAGPTDTIVVEGDLHYHLGDPTFEQSEEDRDDTNPGQGGGSASEKSKERTARDDPTDRQRPDG